MNKLKPLITSRGCAMSAWRNRHRLIHQARASSFTTFIASPMDGSVSTSVSSVRTVYQSHSQHLAESAEGSQSRRDTRDNVPGAAAHSTGEGSSSTYGNADYTEKSAMSSHYSGVMVSAPSSPRMHALVLPSPPDSPGGSPSSSVDDASESSLPSVSSSFFFSSSAAGSPGRSHPSSYPSSHPQSDHEHDHDHDQDHDHQGRHHRRVHEQGLIIPSLSLPDALRRPTPFGQTLGDIRILVLGAQGAGKSFLTGLLLEDNEDVVDVGTWEDWSGAEAGIDVYGKVLRASTDWLEQQNVFGLERFEPTKNVEIIELPGYSHDTDVSQLLSYEPHGLMLLYISERRTNIAAEIDHRGPISIPS